MKQLFKLLFIVFLTCYVNTTFSQTVDSLSIFPNPFNTSATIHFDMEQADTITLRLINLNGQILKTFYNSTVLPSGSYNINLAGDSLINGVYIVRLEIGSSKSITKKVAKTSTNTGVASNDKANQIDLYPNPTNEFITIPISGIKTIIITDNNAKVLKSFTTSNQTISLTELADGLYFITVISNNNQTFTKQIILSKK